MSDSWKKWDSYDVVVVGAGVAGIAAAHALVKAGAGHVALIECAAPLSLTSDKSTECYRNFWPGPDDAMTALMTDSIDHLQALSESTDNRFHMRQSGYLFTTSNHKEVEGLADQALQNSHYGGGSMRLHEPMSQSSYQLSPASGFDRGLDGTDLMTSTEMIRHYFPYLSSDTIAVLHARKCGSLSAQQYGMTLLDAARHAGTDLITGEFVGIQTTAGNLTSVELRCGQTNTEIKTGALVLASGPHLKSTAILAGTELPVLVEKHVKITVEDRPGAIPRDAPLTICNDPVDLGWSNEEREILATSTATKHLCDTFPAGVHGRPVGAGNQIFVYWTLDCETMESPVFPIESDPYLPEILLRGMSQMVPGLKACLDPMPKPFVDGGYYTKVADNRPLIGPLDVPGTFACGAYSGYGIMASYAGAELLSAHVLNSKLPSYASAFAIDRFSNPAYRRTMENLTASGQI